MVLYCGIFTEMDVTNRVWCCIVGYLLNGSYKPYMVLYCGIFIEMDITNNICFCIVGYLLKWML